MVLVPAGWPGMERSISAGGQVEKKPAWEAVEELETVAVMTVEPGWAAVATPVSSMVTMEAVWGVRVTWPTRQVMLCSGRVSPPE